MLYQINEKDKDFSIGEKFVEKQHSQTGLLEKNIENFIAEHPSILFPNEEILVIAQSVSFQNMADVIALDASGNLIVIVIKCDYSSRKTVGQLLEYAAKMKGFTYEQLNEFAIKSGRLNDKTLIEAFRDFSDEQISKEKIARHQRVLIVAPQSDEGLKKVVNWLNSYGVPIEFVPFTVYADSKGDPKLVSMEGATQSLVITKELDKKWERHWIFNTNESNTKGAYEKMFDRNVAAIYGYSNGPRNLQGSSEGDTVLAYVNKKGLLAIGTVTDPKVKKGQGIFMDKGQQLPDEYHIKVEWERANTPITARTASELGYNLPVRTVFGKLHNGPLAKEIVEQMRKLDF